MMGGEERGSELAILTEPPHLTAYSPMGSIALPSYERNTLPLGHMCGSPHPVHHRSAGASRGTGVSKWARRKASSAFMDSFAWGVRRSIWYS